MTIALTALVISSCCSSKNIEGEVPKDLLIEMQKKGFMEGEIVFSDVEGDCAYVIRTNGDAPENLDPINLVEDYKIDGQKIWFKFTSLRMKNRCDKARPIELKEIILRKT